MGRSPGSLTARELEVVAGAPRPTVEGILAEVARHYHVPVDRLRGAGLKTREIKEARDLVVSFARNRGVPFSTICEVLRISDSVARDAFRRAAEQKNG